MYVSGSGVNGHGEDADRVCGLGVASHFLGELRHNGLCEVIEEEQQSCRVLCVATASLQGLWRHTDQVGSDVDHDLLHFGSFHETCFDLGHLRMVLALIV